MKPTVAILPNGKIASLKSARFVTINDVKYDPRTFTSLPDDVLERLGIVLAEEDKESDAYVVRDTSSYAVEDGVVSYSKTARPISNVKAILTSTVESEFKKRTMLGFDTSLGFKVGCREIDLSRYLLSLNLVSLSHDVDEITVRDYGNINRSLTAEQYQQMCLEVLSYWFLLHQKRWGLKDSIATAKTIEELKRIDISF